jgi:TP901 family phage tail tape measure protein
MAGSAVVGILRVLLSANTAEFDAAMAAAATSAKGLTKSFGDAGRQLQNVGMTLTKALTVPLVGLGVSSAKAAIDFESSFAGIRKTVDGVVDSSGELTEAGKAIQQSMRDLAKSIPISVNELNKLGESAGELGIPKEKVVEFTKVMAQLGVTTNLTAQDAASSIARIQNIFGAAGVDTERFASTLVALGNAGASTEKEIVEMGQRIAGAGHAVGLSEAQVLAFASTLASVGINAEAGGSAISRVFLKINDAVAGGGKKLDEFARVAGMSAAQFKKAFETDAAGATNAFITGLGRLKASGENVNATIEGLTGKNIILKDTLLRVSGAGELLSKNLTLANQAWQDNTALTREAEQRFKTTEAQLTLLWNRLKDVGITLGNALLPAITTIAQAIGNALPLVDSLGKAFAGRDRAERPREVDARQRAGLPEADDESGRCAQDIRRVAGEADADG